MGEISVKTGNNARNGGKNSLNRLIRCVCGKKIGPDPRNFNQRVSLGRNDLLIRTFPSIQHLISILESQKQSHDAVISKNRTDEGNISKSTKNDMIELMVKDLGADAQKQQVAIENNDLHRTTALYDSQSMDYLRSQWQALFFTICVVALLVFIACKNTTRRK
ncbi:hypothetical protein RFH01_004891 [Klebsiella pneumoniae]|nr:hypothetical protein [Klebsiella pneumoniae]